VNGNSTSHLRRDLVTATGGPISATPVGQASQITDGQIQAASTTPVKQITDGQIQADASASHANSTALIPHSLTTLSSSISKFSTLNPASTPSAPDPRISEKANIGAGVVVGACGIRVLICFLIRWRSNRHDQHGEANEKEDHPKPQLQYDELGIRGELACAELDDVPAMEKIHALPPAEDPPTYVVNEMPAAEPLSAV